MFVYDIRYVFYYYARRYVGSYVLFSIFFAQTTSRECENLDNSCTRKTYKSKNYLRLDENFNIIILTTTTHVHTLFRNSCRFIFYIDLQS